MTRPWLWRLIVRRLTRRLPEPAVASVLGDLLEDYRRDRESRGALRAEWRSWRDARSLVHAYREPAITLESVWEDVRLAVRGYIRTPLFTVAVLATLGLGIGANTAIFTLVDGVLLRPLPYREPDRLVRIYHTNQSTGERRSLSPPNYFDLKTRNRTLVDLAAYWTPEVTISNPGAEPEKLLAVSCASELFAVLGASPALGRSFATADDVPGAPRVTVLGHALWLRRFGGDPSAIGRDILLDGGSIRIIGVMPAGFGFPSDAAELWVPLRLSATTPPNPGIPPERYRQYRILSVVGRIRDGLSVDASRADLAAVSVELSREYPEANRATTLTELPLHEVVVGASRTPLLILLAGVVGVFLVACANVASLMLVRSATRTREVAVRLALGASRGRVARQMVADSLVLSMAGGGLGLAFAPLVTGLLVRFAPTQLPRLADVHVDFIVVLYALATAAAAGVIFAAAPAWQARAYDLARTLRLSGRIMASRSQRWLHHALVVAEVALSLTLLIAAALLAQSLLRERGIETGFQSAHVLVVDRIELPRSRLTPEASADFFAQLLTSVRALPRVHSAAATLGVPLDRRARFFVDESSFSVAGQPAVPRGQQPMAALHVITPDYFRTIGVALIEGREFSAQDRAGAPGVVVINQAMAKRFWPDRDPVGQRLTHDLTIVPGQSTTREVVGVISDIRHFALEEPAEPQMYIPHQQMPWPAMALVVETDADAEPIGRAIREAVWRIDASIPVPAPRQLSAVVSDTMAESGFRTSLVSVFAGVALMLAAIGVYGTMAYSVQQRRQEIGLRVALGASWRQASRPVRRTGLVLIATGSGIGLLAAGQLTRSLSSILFGITAVDPVTFLVAPLVLAAVGWLACALPTRNAGRADPIRMMNSER